MKIKDWAKRQMAAVSLALTSVEKNVLGQDGSAIEQQSNQERRHQQGSLADSLLRGELTEEVKNLRHRMYKVFKSSSTYELNLNNELTKSVPLDGFDSYPLEMVFYNGEIGLSIVEAVNSLEGVEELNQTNYSVRNKANKSLQVVRESITKFDIEKYTTKLNIRVIEGNRRLLEFCVNKYEEEFNMNQKLFLNEVKKLIQHGPSKIDFLEIKEVGFITDNSRGVEDLLLFGYNNIIFDKVIEFNGSYVIKFIADVAINGEDVTEKYVQEELEKKYENKEVRNSTL